MACLFLPRAGVTGVWKGALRRACTSVRVGWTREGEKGEGGTEAHGQRKRRDGERGVEQYGSQNRQEDSG